MSKPKRIDLNRYVQVDTEEGLEGFQGLIIVPRKLGDGTTPPELYFRGRESKKQIVDTDNAVWDKSVHIHRGDDTEAGRLQYLKRVDWWFKNALNDPEYEQMILDTCKYAMDKYDFDVEVSTRKAIDWLKSKSFVLSSRKTFLHKFYYDWLIKGANITMNAWNRNHGGK